MNNQIMNASPVGHCHGRLYTVLYLGFSLIRLSCPMVVPGILYEWVKAD